MSYITSFMDGEKYGAQDINKVVSRFVHSGVEEAFIDGEPYNVRRLNDLSKPVTTRGVIGSESAALMVTKIGDSYYISPGTAFFGNGSTLEVISNEAITLPDPSTVNYVFLVSSEEENRNYVQVDTTEPELASENVVMLAEISADGVITDRRCYATGKLRGMYQDNEFTLKSIRVQDSLVFPDGVDKINITHDLGCSDFHMMVYSSYDRVNQNGDYVPYGYDEFKENEYDNFKRLSVWLPKQDRFFCVEGYAPSSSDVGSNFAYDTESYVEQWRFGLGGRNGKCFIIVDRWVVLEITHISGTNWNFCYSNLSGSLNYYRNLETDFKIYYI